MPGLMQIQIPENILEYSPRPGVILILYKKYGKIFTNTRCYTDKDTTRYILEYLPMSSVILIKIPEIY